MSPQSHLNESLLLILVILFKYLIKRSFVPKFIEVRYYEAPRPASPACCCRTRLRRDGLSWRKRTAPEYVTTKVIRL